ncbi:MAG: gamma-glutamyltransferase [Phycisphaerales bacterium]|nr:gamma-glutamyltransferase [Phycisphaerales bacterium]
MSKLLCLRPFSLLPAVLSAIATLAITPPAPAGPPDPASYSATFEHAAVAADHPLASQAGAEILEKGGNAVDAAVAVSFALSVVRPESCGIGGGGFMVIHLQDDPRFGTLTTAINYREQCPTGIDSMYYTRPENAEEFASTRGAKAVAIPGTVAGLFYALEKYGTLKPDIVLAPAIRAAEGGFIADDHIVSSARDIGRWIDKDPILRRERFAFAWERFCARGTLKAGDRLTLPEQAQALRLLAQRGAGVFYFGEIGQAIIAAIQRDGGPMLAADLASFKVDEIRPLQVEAAGRTFHCMPPPSSGGMALAQTLGILERSPQKLTDHPRQSPASIHLLAETMKHAFADRARWLGDPAFGKVPVERLMSDEYLRQRAAVFDPTHTLATDRYGTTPGSPGEAVDDGGTSHFSVIDARGNAVACTETINLEFGSLLCVPEFGFALNNQMDDFLTRPGEANAFGLTQSRRNLPEPGKRPLSSMSPTIAISKDTGRVELIAGAAGGPRIISATLQIIINALIHRMTAADAMAAPRFHTQWMPDTLWLEDELRGGGLESGLVTLGHHTAGKCPQAAAQMILIRDRRIEAASDPRKGGRPAGY